MIFYDFSDTLKNGQTCMIFITASFKMRDEWLGFTIFIKRITVYGFGGHCLNIRDVCMVLNHVPRSIAWSLFTLKASNVVKWLSHSQLDLSCGGVRLSIGWNWKFTPLPCTILEWPIPSSPQKFLLASTEAKTNATVSCEAIVSFMKISRS